MNNFNRIARFYDLLTYIVFRNTLKKSQLYFINKIPHNANVLIVGGGTGWYLYELLKINRCKKIYYIEASSGMMELSKKRVSLLSHKTEIEFIENNIENISIPGQFDVVVTNYILDVFKKEQLTFVMNKLFNALKKEGLWFFSDFRINNSSFHKYWQILFSKIMYVFFRFVSGLENNKLLLFDEYFKKFSVTKLSSKNFFSGMIESSIYKKYI